MYLRGSSLGKNIWDDGQVHIPPGYKGNAFRTPIKRDEQLMDTGKIHLPEQKLYAGSRRQHTIQSESDREQEGDEHTVSAETGIQPEEDNMENPYEYRNEEEFGAASDETLPYTEEHRTKREIYKENSISSREEQPHLQELFTGLLSLLGREEWLLIMVLILLWADGSEAWDVMLFLIFLLGIH